MNTNEQRTETMRGLFAAHRLHHVLCEHMFCQFDLHRSQHHILMYLSGQEQIPSQKQIADRFEISPAAVAVTLKKLESNGFVERITSKTDNRFNEIRITEKGRDVVRKSAEYFAYIDAATFQGFSEEELQQLSALLARTAQNLKATLDIIDTADDKPAIPTIESKG